MPLCYRLEAGGLRLFLRVTPNAGRNSIDGVEQRDNGSAVLRLRVTAAPDKGKANVAVITLLSKALGVPKSNITVVNGETSRLKTLYAVGDETVLAERLQRLL